MNFSWLKPKGVNANTALRYLSSLILPLTFILSAITGLAGLILSLKDKIDDKRGVIIFFVYLGLLAAIEILVLGIQCYRGSTPAADEENQVGRSPTNESWINGSESGSMQDVDGEGKRRVIVRDPAGCRRV